MTDEKNAAARRAGIRRHALWLAAAAVGVFVTYIAYVYVYMMNN